MCCYMGLSAYHLCSNRVTAGLPASSMPLLDLNLMLKQIKRWNFFGNLSQLVFEFVNLLGA